MFEKLCDCVLEYFYVYATVRTVLDALCSHVVHAYVPAAVIASRKFHIYILVHLGTWTKSFDFKINRSIVKDMMRRNLVKNFWGHLCNRRTLDDYSLY